MGVKLRAPICAYIHIGVERHMVYTLVVWAPKIIDASMNVCTTMCWNILVHCEVDII